GRQPRAGNVQFEVPQLLRGVAAGNAGDASYEMIFRRAQRLDLEASRTVMSFQRTVTCDRGRVLRERPKLHFAAHPVRSTDTSNADTVGHSATLRAVSSRPARVHRRASLPLRPALPPPPPPPPPP